MSSFGFCGGSYASQGFSADAQDLINWYLEISENPASKSRFQLFPTPGLSLFATLPDKPVRAEFEYNGRFFAVAGSKFCEVSSAGVVSNQQTVANDGLPASMCSNGVHVLIASGGTMYTLKLSDNTFATISSPTGVSMVDYVDGYAVALLSNSRSFQISGLNDFTSWSGLDVGTVSVFPENLVSMRTDHRQIILWGNKKAVIYYNSGASSFPFEPVPGSGLIESGCGAVWGTSRLDSSVFWWEQTEHGSVIARKLNGYSPQRISKEPIEYAIQNYATWTDVISYAYQDQGHIFWVNYFPSANVTWVYDAKTGEWHKRAFLLNGSLIAHRSQCHAFAFNKHLVGDWLTGNVYQMAIPKVSGSSWAFADDFGSPLKRVRRSPYVGSKQPKWDYHQRLEFLLDAGLGPIPPLSGPDPAYLGIPSSLILADSNGVLWNVVMSDLGILGQTTTTSGTAQTVILKDNSASPSTAWTIGITTGGLLKTTAATYSASLPQSYQIASASNFVGSISVTSGGVIQTSTPLSGRGPQLMVRLSKDNAQTWGNEMQFDCGAAGKYGKRIFRHRFGRSWGLTGMVIEASTTDPVPWRITDVDLQTT